MYRKNFLHKIELEKLTDAQRKFLDRFTSLFKGHPEAVQLALEIYNNLTNPLRMKKMLTAELAENCGQSYEKVAADCERDYYLSPDAAIAYGLIDKKLSRR